MEREGYFVDFPEGVKTPGSRVPTQAGGEISGSGVDNRIARWDGASALQSSGFSISDAGQMGAPDGSVSDPSYSFLNDLDCGDYRISANSVGRSVGGVLVQSWELNGAPSVVTTYARTAAGVQVGRVEVTAPSGDGDSCRLRVMAANTKNAYLGFGEDFVHDGIWIGHSAGSSTLNFRATSPVGTLLCSLTAAGLFTLGYSGIATATTAHTVYGQVRIVSGQEGGGSNLLSTLVLGGDNGANTLTNNTQKTALISGAHYSNSQYSFAAIRLVSGVSANTVEIGGSSAQSTTHATAISFLTATSATSTTSVGCGSIDSTGTWTIGSASNLQSHVVAGRLFVNSGSNSIGSLRIGADDNLSTVTNSTAKRGILTVPHYTNAQAPCGILECYSDASNVQVSIGGISTNATTIASIIDFYVASNNTTTSASGLRRMRLSSTAITQSLPPAYSRQDVASAAAISSMSITSGFVYLTGSTATTIQGINSGEDGKRLVVVNLTGQIMTIANESGSATASNRITTLTGADVATTANGAAEFIYDTTTSRWVCLWVSV